MKQGKSIVELAIELQRQAESKADYIAPAEKLRAVVERDGGSPQVLLDLHTDNAYPINSHAHGQIAQFLNVPKAYYDRCVQQEPELAVNTINTWLQRQEKPRLVRTLDDRVRAFLSNSYRTIENPDLAEAVLPILSELEVEVVSADITETKFYIKAVDKSILKDIPAGKKLGDAGIDFFDTVAPAIVISNSEVGAGAFTIQSSIWTKACTNLCVIEKVLRKTHLGGRAALSDEVYELLSDHTKSVTDAALFSQVKDLTRLSFDEARFQAHCDKLIEAGQDEITDSPVKVIERVQKKFGWNESQRDSVLSHLIKGGDLSRYGLHSAVTRTAEDLDDYDVASEFEQQGGQIIHLKKSEWREIAAAA